MCIRNMPRLCEELCGGPGRNRGSKCGRRCRDQAVGYLQEAICLAYHSWFSVGGALFHYRDYEGYLDTVTYGCWRKRTLQEIGLFDEQFARNEDDELNLRIVRNGGKIWQSRRIKSWYCPRDSIALLFRQYLQYGYWKVCIVQNINGLHLTDILLQRFRRDAAHSCRGGRVRPTLCIFVRGFGGRLSVHEPWFSLSLCSKLSKLKFPSGSARCLCDISFRLWLRLLERHNRLCLFRRPASASLMELTRRSVSLRPAQPPVRQTTPDTRE